MRQVWEHMWSKTRLKTVVVKSVDQEYHFSHTRKIPIVQLVWEKTQLHKNTMRQKSCCSIGVLEIWTNNTMRQIGGGSQSLVFYGIRHKGTKINLWYSMVGGTKTNQSAPLVQQKRFADKTLLGQDFTRTKVLTYTQRQVKSAAQKQKLKCSIGVTNNCTISTKRHIYKFCCCHLSISGAEVDLTLRLHGVCIRSMISTECGKQNRKPQK